MTTKTARREPKRITDISVPSEQLAHVDPQDLLPLPPPYDKVEELPGFKALTEEQRNSVEATFDDAVCIGVPKPKSKEEEDRYVEAFIRGLKKLFSKENNWTFLEPLVLSMEHCARCQTCVDDCPVYLASGRNEAYRPTFRSEVLRRLYYKYVKPGSKMFKTFQQGDIELNWTLLSRLRTASPLRV